MQIVKYAARRILLVIPQMLLISVATFVLIRMLPGDPARLQLGPMASDEGVAALREQLRLDDSVPAQYMAYLERLFQGDLGRSWVNSTNVRDDLIDRIPATLELIVLGMLLVLVVLVPLGIITAARGGGPLTRGLKKVTFGYGLLAGALPDFWLGLLFIFVFFTTLGVLPGTRSATPPRRWS
jgi:peptide/nickel transport system permease protein